jgi:hypothetical protein
MRLGADELSLSTLIHWPAPWRAVAQSGERVALEAELGRELAPAHSLFGKVGSVIGRDESSDDVVTELVGGGFAIVHLTWSGRIDPDPEQHPAVRMLPDVQDLLADLDTRANELGEDD